jgi:hypothetical protein
VATGRTQSVSNALLGTLNTAELRPGTYTLRLRVFDSAGNNTEATRSFLAGSPAASPPPLLPSPRPISGTASPIPPQATPRATAVVRTPTRTPTPRRG